MTQGTQKPGRTPPRPAQPEKPGHSQTDRTTEIVLQGLFRAVVALMASRSSQNRPLDERHTRPRRAAPGLAF